MRTFYLFKIKNNIKKHNQNNYNIYKALESIYYQNKSNLKYYYDYFTSIRDLFNKKQIDKILYETYKDYYTYSKVNNIHMINDYFNQEKSRLVIKKNYLCLKSTKSLPTFLKDMHVNQNIFVCDFKTRDYFWLEDLV